MGWRPPRRTRPEKNSPISRSRYVSNMIIAEVHFIYSFLGFLIHQVWRKAGVYHFDTKIIERENVREFLNFVISDDHEYFRIISMYTFDALFQFYRMSRCWDYLLASTWVPTPSSHHWRTVVIQALLPRSAPPWNHCRSRVFRSAIMWRLSWIILWTKTLWRTTWKWIFRISPDFVRKTLL